MNTFWVTFYSYKGGVGRTMALANVAAMLAKEGRRVLLIDFDLEAPGLDAFEGLGCAKGHSGVVEYVAEYLSSGKAPPINAFVRECVPASTHLRGKLWLMPSGKKDQQYNRNRARINWTELYDKYDGERFVENWKADIEKNFSPDYVLIDSRTGLTDVGGVCTLHLPQLVVLLYALNDQNIHGIAGVARAVSKAENTRPPQLLTVASPVPPMPREKSGLLQERLDMAEKELGIKPHCQIHYDSRVPLKEQVIVWEDPHSRLGSEYRTLRELIADYDVRGLDFLIKESGRAIEELDLDRAEEAGTDLLREYSDRPESHYQRARIARALGKVDEIEANLRRAIELDPFYSQPCVELVGLLKVQKRYSEAIQIEKQRLEAITGKGDKEAESGVRFALGQLCMMAGEYSDAIDVYSGLPRRATNHQQDDFGLLANAFNYAEARRRAGESVPISELKEVITLYERGAATEGSGPVVMRLNHMQAMHIPYALVGDMERARQLLLQVEELATSVSPRERIFSVASYKELPTSEFLKQNMQMIEALKEGKLWDQEPTSDT